MFSPKPTVKLPVHRSIVLDLKGTLQRRCTSLEVSVGMECLIEGLNSDIVLQILNLVRRDSPPCSEDDTEKFVA